MPRKLPKYCERYRDRHGKLRVYFRKAGCLRVALPIDAGSDEFRVAYAQALLSLRCRGKRKTNQPLSARSKRWFEVTTVPPSSPSFVTLLRGDTDRESKQSAKRMGIGPYRG